MSPADKLDAKWEVQLRKGTLEMVILGALKGRTLYGLALLNLLHEFETMTITEGTLYPLLDRLKRDGLVKAYWQQEGDTRPRKYFQLTEFGEQKLEDVTRRWRQSVRDIEQLLGQPGPETITKGEK